MIAIEASFHASGSATTTTAVLTPELILGRILSLGRAPASHCRYISVSGHTRHPRPTKCTLKASPSPVLASVAKSVGGSCCACRLAALIHCGFSSKNVHDARRRWMNCIASATSTETVAEIAATAPHTSMGPDVCAGVAMTTQYREGGIG